MAAFSAASFSYKSYAAFRPEYPRLLYDTMLNYQGRSGGRKVLLDLGCGHGVITRYLSQHFEKVLAVDPSAGMLDTARNLTPESQYPNIEFHRGTSENLHFVADKTVDLAVAGQAAHWFDYAKTWPELGAKIRPGGSLAFWGLKDTVFVDYPKAVAILRDYSESPDPEKLGSYWSKPGWTLIASKYRDIQPPQEEWEDVERIEYDPGTEGKNSGTGTVLVSGRMRIGDCKELFRTWSACHNWKEAHPDRKKRSEGGEGDVIDACFDEIAEAEKEWRDEDFEVDIEYESFLLMARRK